jgi:hypothetical protein
MTAIAIGRVELQLEGSLSLVWRKVPEYQFQRPGMTFLSPQFFNPRTSWREGLQARFCWAGGVSGPRYSTERRVYLPGKFDKNQIAASTLSGHLRGPSLSRTRESPFPATAVLSHASRCGSESVQISRVRLLAVFFYRTLLDVSSLKGTIDSENCRVLESRIQNDCSARLCRNHRTHTLA